MDGATGEVRAVFDSGSQPDGVLLVACGDRRAAVCASCSETYRRDLWHVVAGGLTGGGGEGSGLRAETVSGLVPDGVGRHPRLFLTLTAPSFGPVHTVHRDGSPCRPRAARNGRVRVCAHGRAVGCGLRHSRADRTVGSPLCADCFDYAGVVLWNSSVGELWRRTRIYADRALAREVSAVVGRRVPTSRLRDVLRVSYIKVAEFQKRGLVHLHIVARLDGVDPEDRDRIAAPPSWASAALLRSAFAAAVPAVGVELSSPDGLLRVAQWGAQWDASDVSAASDGSVAAGRRTAAYLSKYATKTAGGSAASGWALARRIRTLRVAWLRRQVGEHLARMVETAWTLGAEPGLEGLRRWAHSLGHPGHLATKSRRYSLTLGALRQARRSWRAEQRRAAGEDDPWADDAAVRVGEWRYVARGYASLGDAALAERMAEQHAFALAEYRDQIARENAFRAEVGLPPVPARGSSRGMSRAASA